MVKVGRLKLIETAAVRVTERHRRDLGDLSELARSIDTIGLLHPIVVTPDNRLIAGERRLKAAVHLGWDVIPANEVGSLDEASDLLVAERDENVCRKDMTPSELVALGKALEAIERPRAVARQRAGQSKGGKTTNSLPDSGTRKKETRTREIVGKALGVSGSYYQRVKLVADAAEAGDPRAQATLKEMDATGNVGGPYHEYRNLTKRDKRDPLWIPASDDIRQEAVKQRVHLTRYFADKGSTSDQIAETLGVTYNSLRRIARRHEIEIPADGIVGKRKRVDSQRVANQIVLALSHVTAGDSLIDWDAISKEEASEWVPILDDAMSEISAFVRKVKEITK